MSWLKFDVLRAEVHTRDIMARSNQSTDPESASFIRLKGGYQLIKILGLSSMYFDTVVVEVKKNF